jgi:hypothetical protein
MMIDCKREKGRSMLGSLLARLLDGQQASIHVDVRIDVKIRCQ